MKLISYFVASIFVSFITLTAIFYMQDLYDMIDLYYHRRLLGTVTSERHKGMHGDRPFQGYRKRQISSPLDSKKDCNGNSYLSLKVKYAIEGGVTFKSCSLQNKLVDEVSLFTETVQSDRATNVWYHHNAVQDLALDPDTLEFLGYIHDRGAFPFQTLNFRVGTQQRTHADIIHFDTLPERGLMTAAWVALEDIHPDSGPLVWYPGSHKKGYWDYDELGMRLQMSSINLNFDEDLKLYNNLLDAAIERVGLKPAYATLKKGETFVWAYSLLHGGSKVNNPALTRKSQVTHYWLTGATSYWQPRNSLPAIGKITYKCEIPVCVESPGQHTNCLEKQQQAFKQRKINHVDWSLPWTDKCKIR